jgi:predicted NBD/HSP70 family sugar kinase
MTLSKHDSMTINLSRVLRLIWREGSISRSLIARNLGLDKSTVTDIVSKLLDTGLITTISQGQASKQGGRRPVFLGINKNFGVVVGIELQPDTYRLVVVNLSGEILFYRTESISTNVTNLEDVSLDLLRMVQEECRKLGRPLIGAAFGTTGIINPGDGKIIYSIPLRIDSVYDFIDRISDRTDVPLFLENDANCCAWGELAFHKRSTLKNFLYVLVEFRDRTGNDDSRYGGISVGMGFVIGGKVYYGNDFSAGEWRSAFCTDPDKGQLSLPEEEAWAVSRNEASFKRFIVELSKNIAMLVNALNLNQVFLGGVLKRYEDLVTPILTEEIRLNWPYKKNLQVQCAIHYSSFGENAVAYGAAGMVLERLFGLPEVFDRKSALNRSRKRLLAGLDRITGNGPDQPEQVPEEA